MSTVADTDPGALFWVVELWSPNKEAGVTDYKWIDWYREHPVEDDLKLLAWSDGACARQAYVDWRPFLHPQLGAVEIGGWDKMNFWRNPPPHLREAILAAIRNQTRAAPELAAAPLPGLDDTHRRVEASAEEWPAFMLTPRA